MLPLILTIKQPTVLSQDPFQLRRLNSTFGKGAVFHCLMAASVCGRQAWWALLEKGGSSATALASASHSTRLHSRLYMFLLRKETSWPSASLHNDGP